MATAKRKWVEVFHSTVPGHAQLVASLLDAIGLDVNVRKKKTQGTEDSIPHVQVRSAQANRAKDVLDSYGLSP